MIAIGLEMFLGKNYSYYELLQFPSFKQLSMARAYIPASFARAWMMKEFPDHPLAKAAQTQLDRIVKASKKSSASVELGPNVPEAAPAIRMP